MKKTLRITSIFLVVMLFVTSISVIFTNAASYPLIWCNTTGDTFVKGQVANLEFTIMPEYTNEKYYVEIYNEKGSLVGSASDSYYNTSVLHRNLTITVNTADYKVGKYTVKYRLSFYSYMSWHDAPNEYTSYFYVIEDKCKGNHTFGATQTITSPSCEKEGTGIKTCKNCGYKEDVSLPAISHKFSEYTSKDDLNHTAICDTCDEKVTSKHTWGIPTIVTKPSESSNGTAKYKCTKCGHTVVKSIPAVTIGDINANGNIDSMDYVLLKRAYFGTFSLDDTAVLSADINTNGGIDSMDYVLLKRAYFGTYQIENAGSNSNPSDNTAKQTAYTKLAKYIKTNGVRQSNGDYWLKKNKSVLSGNSWYIILCTDSNATSIKFIDLYIPSIANTSTTETIYVSKNSDKHNYTEVYEFGGLTSSKHTGDFYGNDFGENNYTAVYNITSTSSTSSEELGEHILELLKEVDSYLGNLNMGVTLGDLGFKKFVEHEHTKGAAATCTTDQICTECKEILVPAKGHNYKWVISKEAQIGESGLEEYKCSVCGDVSETKIIPALKEEENQTPSETIDNTAAYTKLVNYLKTNGSTTSDGYYFIGRSEGNTSTASLYTIIMCDPTGTELELTSSFECETGTTLTIVSVSKNSDKHFINVIYSFTSGGTVEQSGEFYGSEFSSSNLSAVYNVETSLTSTTLDPEELGADIDMVLDNVGAYLEDVGAGVTLYDLGFIHY